MLKQLTSIGRVLRAAALCAFLVAGLPRLAGQVLFGDQTVEPSLDSNTVGQAEAFQVTAALSGSVGSMTVYLDSTSASTNFYIGLYADNGGHPGALLTQGNSTTLNKGAWNTISVPPVSVVAGTRYWIAILGTAGGKPAFRDRVSGSCSSEGSSQSNLQQLPATWSTGAQYPDCPISAYGTAIVASTPVLSVAPLSASLTAAPGGADPLPFTVTVNNTGTGTLNFTLASDSPWLQAAPTQGAAPASFQVSASGAGLALGSYTGHITVTANGAQGSPAVVTVTLTVARVADWLMVDHDPNRSGNAVDETTITTSNVASLQLSWSATVDGPVTAQPLFVGGGGVQKDMLVVATGGNSVYSFDAATGAVLWRRNFGAQPGNCAIPGGYGVTGAPLIDRVFGRVYLVSNDGIFRTLNLSDGNDAAPGFALISNAATNKVWGGLNKVGDSIYLATASDGRDTAPWRGMVYKVNVAANPVLAASWVVVPGIAAPNGGGGIWGYGGVGVDPATGIVYAASGSDSQMPEGYTPYANRIIALDSNLNLLGSYGPSQPSNFPCNGAPCDLDFGSTPLVFQPAGCPMMITTGNKNGVLYLFKATDLATSAMPFQSLTLNAA
ncbi:MAG: PQQ-binding-like beta-propeller repeat protein, partial [Paludibaculum sp.]